MRYDIRLAGVGGQGLILAGMILGEAASIFSRLNAVQTQSYAPMVRGAPSMSEVVISDADIDFPMVENADILLALVQDAYDEYRVRMKPGGWVIVEASAVETQDDPKVRLLALPLGGAAREAGAPPIAATTVALGVVARLIEVVPEEALRAALRLRVPSDSREVNLAALEAGFKLLER